MGAAALPTPYRSALRGMQMRSSLASLAVLALAAMAGALVYHTVKPWLLLRLWLAAELAFAVVFARRKARMDMIPPRHEPADHDGWTAFRRFMQSSAQIARTTSIGELLKQWFGNIKESDIKRDNVADLLCYGFFFRTRETMESLGLGHLAEQMVAEVEEAWAHRFEPGWNPDLSYMQHIWEPLHCVWKPLAFYALGEFLPAVKHAMMLASGFDCYSHGGYVYYTRGVRSPAEAASCAPLPNDRTPILFSHGVGGGLLPYVPWVQRLAATGHPVVAVEFKHLAMRWTHHLPSCEDVGDNMAAILKLHGIGSAAVMGHSFGTFFASKLVHNHPQMVHTLMLVDPVTCCMWSGHLMSNFIYFPARSTTGLSTWAISRDIHTAISVSRGFFWTDMNLWPHMVPERCLMVIGGRDDLVPVKHVRRMIRKETRAAVMVHPYHAHADWTFDYAWQEETLAEFVQIMTVGMPPTDSASTSSLETSGSDDGLLVRVTPGASAPTNDASPPARPYTRSQATVLQGDKKAA